MTHPDRRHSAAKFSEVTAAIVLLASAAPVVAQTQPPQFERAWGSTGSGAGQFQSARGITCDDAGNVYVTDTGGGVAAGSIHKFDNDGVYLASWSMAGSEELIYPEDAAVSPDGHLFVVEEGSRIHKFTLDGTHVLSFGSCCSGEPGRLRVPMGIDIDESGLVYVADAGNERIAVFDGQGTFVRSWSAGLEQVMAVACNDQGTVFVQDIQTSIQMSRVKAFTSTGSFLVSWGNAYPDSPLGSGSLDCGAQRFVVTAWADQKLRMTNWGGVPLVDDWGGDGIQLGKFREIAGIAIDPEDNIFVLDGALNRVTKYSAVTVPARSTSWGRVKAEYR